MALSMVQISFKASGGQELRRAKEKIRFSDNGAHLLRRRSAMFFEICAASW